MLTPEQKENFILKIVAEQTTSISDEMDSLKKDTKRAFDELSQTLVTCFNNMKEENSEKCKMLGNSVVKLYNKMNRFEKSLGRSNQHNVASKKNTQKTNDKSQTKEDSINAKTKEDNINAKTKEDNINDKTKSVPKSSRLPTSTSSPPPSDVTPPPTNSPPLFTRGKPKVLYVGDSVGHTANLRLVD